jgi:hypothetical protein
LCASCTRRACWASNPYRRARVRKKTAVDDPLLKVPPASRGNQVGAWFGSPSRIGKTSTPRAAPPREVRKPARPARLPPREVRKPARPARLPPREAWRNRALIRFPSRSGGNLRRGGAIVNSGSAVDKCLCVGFSTCPPPNLPRERGRSRDSLPAHGEGWGGGTMFKSLRKDTYYAAAGSAASPAARILTTRSRRISM